METQNRPELKVGDRVRFRSDGEIGELNRSQNINTEIFHIVKKICKDGRVYHEGGGAYAQVQFDICNDFSDIQVGDKVERYWKNWKYKITTDTVESVSENEFKIGYGLSISKADGIHGNFPNRGDFWYVLRIVEKAKPKPLLADAKVGDLCKLRNGEWVQICEVHGNSVFKYPNPIKHTHIIICDETGDTEYWGKVEDFDIVHTEPLAPEGSAEWAWQMLNLLGLPIYHPAEGVLTIPVPYSSERFAHCYAKTGWLIHEPVSESPQPESPIDPIERPLRELILRAKENGKNIRTYYQNMIFTPDALTKLLAEGRFRWWNICNWELTDKEQNFYPPIKLVKPDPEFKVGDWVEFRDIEGIKHGMVEGIQEEYSIFCAGVSQSVGKKFIIRKLKPSEVIVNIGCLSGTVSMPTPVVFYLKDTSGRTACIPFAMLDAQTRSLVESLLKAQEEEKK